MLYRAAQNKDLEQINLLWISLMELTSSLTDSYSLKKNASGIHLKSLKYYLKNPNHKVIVALEHNAVAGFIHGVIEENDVYCNEKCKGFINELFVESACRNKGAGRELINKLLDWFKSKNVRTVELATHVKNKNAQEFYEKTGWERTFIKYRKITQ